MNKKRKKSNIISDGNLGMGSSAILDEAIKRTLLYQDVDLATALNISNKNPAELQAYIESQKQAIFSDVVKQKNDTFNKVYDDFDRAAKAQESVLMYKERSNELTSVREQVYNNQKNVATAIVDDTRLAKRKNEMNEWSVGNKNDTLFVYSSLFIALSGLLLCVVLWKLGIMSASFCGSLAALLIIIFILILLNRYQYTDITRDKRYWNRKNFGGKYGRIPIPSCPGMMDDITSDVSAAYQNVQNSAMNAGNRMNTAMTSLGNAARTAQGAPV